MRDAEKYINNIEFTNWDDLLEGHRYLHVSKLKELIIKIQKDAYNQAIENVFEYQLLNGCLETNEDMVNNLKIK